MVQDFRGGKQSGEGRRWNRSDRGALPENPVKFLDQMSGKDRRKSIQREHDQITDQEGLHQEKTADPKNFQNQRKPVFMPMEPCPACTYCGYTGTQGYHLAYDEKKGNDASAQQGNIQFDIRFRAHEVNLVFLRIIGLDKWARFGFHLFGQVKP